jgi:thiamine biosynthesis lipoprotein
MGLAVYRGLAAVAAALACAGCGRGTAMPGPPAAKAAPLVRVAETTPLMGVAWTITVHARDRDHGKRAIAAGFAEAGRLERILSDYDPESELSRLSAAAPTPKPVGVSDDLWNVLARADEIRELTNGAFDITVGPLTTLWRQSRRSGHLPRPDKLAAAQAAVGVEAIVLDREARTVALTRPGMRLDPGGIGMGHAADRVLAVLAGCGIESAMVDASGDVVVSAAPPGTAGWRIEVAPMPGDRSGAVVMLENAAITTSGDARQFVEIEGRRFSHIVDPATGLGVTGPAAVTVIAPDCTTADAVATAASVLGHERGPAMIARFPGVSARFVWWNGESVTTSVTPDWPGHGAAATQAFPNPRDPSRL